MTIFEPPLVVGRVLWGRVCPSFCLSVCFRWTVLLGFCKFWHIARSPYEVVHDRARFSRKKFCPQNWENGHKMRQKLSFLNLLKNLINFINFYWISSVMKIYVICCAPAQIPYLGRFLFLRYRPICFQPTRLQDFLINHISRKNQSNSLFFCMLSQIHINVDQNIFGWA